MSSERIIVGTDLGSLSQACVSAGADVAKALAAEVELLHAADLPEIEASSAIPEGMNSVLEVLSERIGERRKQIELRLGEQQRTCEEAGVTCHARVVEGRPWHALADASRKSGTRMIIVGSRGDDRPLIERMLGTTTERIVHQSACPVLILNTSAEDMRLQAKHWVVGVDFSEASEEAALFADRLASATKGRISLVHILPLSGDNEVLGLDDEIQERWQQLAENQLAALAEKLQSDTETYTAAQEVDASAAHRLCTLAKEISGDILVVGGGAQSTVARMMLGSTADRCLRYARSPVLVVK